MCVPYLVHHLLLWVLVITWIIARLFALVGCVSASMSEENCSLFLCAAALYCAHFCLTAPYCPVLPYATLFSPVRTRNAPSSHVLPRSFSIHAGEQKGGQGGGGATRARSRASGESCAGGAGGERGDGNEEHGGIVWAGARRKRTMPLWRQWYNFRRTALVGRRRRDACIPGPLCCGGRDYLSVVCLVLTHACVVVCLVVTFLPLTCLVWPSCT